MHPFFLIRCILLSDIILNPIFTLFQIEPSMTDLTVTDATHSSHLVDELVIMRQNGEMFDYLIKGSKESFNIHSLVLATMSPVFRAMMQSDMAEAAKKEATFPHISDVIMAKVIDYAYKGTCTFTRDHLMDLIKAAHYLQITKLLKLCEEHVITVLQPSNCFSWYSLAEQLLLTTTLPKVQKVMRTSYKHIIATPGFKLLEMKELVPYLEDVREHGTCSDDLLCGLLEWITHDKQNRATNLQELFSVISVGKCSEQSILKMMADNADLLYAQDDVYKLMISNILTNTRLTFQLGKDKTFVIIGGETCHDVPNPRSWILKGDQFEQYCNVRTDQNIKPRHSLCQIPGGLMLSGGEESDMCSMFVLSMKIWVKQRPMPSKRSYHGSGYISGKVLVISGVIADDYKRSVDLMDFETKKWSQGPPLPVAVNLPKVVTCKTTMFVLSSKECDFWQLDTEKMSWLTKSSIPESSFGCSVASSEENIFAAGGDNNINYMYTPETDVWCCLTRPSLVERQGALVYFQKQLYLFAGCRKNAQLIDVEEYDINSDKWSLSKWKLPMPLKLFTAVLTDISH